MSVLLKFSKQLRANQTEAEKIFWSMVRANRFHGLKFKRQIQINGYIVDFVCLSLNLIVEIDGAQHTPENDAVRSENLKSAGFHVKRYWNEEILRNPEGVYAELENTILGIQTPLPNPLPMGEGTL